MERVMPYLGEAYFLSGFMGGLKDKIRLMVRMLKPTTLAEAVEVAKLQEELVDTKKPKTFTKTYTSNFVRSTTNYNPNSPYSNSKNSQAYTYPPKSPTTDSQNKITISIPITNKSNSTRNSPSVNQSINNSALLSIPLSPLLLLNINQNVVINLEIGIFLVTNANLKP